MRSLIDIARLEEHRLATVCREIATDCLPMCGGVASRAAPGSWANSLFGAGMEGPIDADELPAIIDWYSSKGIEPRAELCPYAHPSLIQGLAALSFVVRDFDNVLFCELDPGKRFDPIHPAPRELKITLVNRDDPAEVRAYSETVIPQFQPGQDTIRESELEVSDRAVRHPRTVALAAWMDGRIVGGGAMEIFGELATLWGLAVTPEYRRRGIQQALLSRRLHIARDRGATLATIGSRPGQGTERNVRRMGFQVAYTKVILARPGPGLAPVLT